jgi:hypothetical protein
MLLLFIILGLVLAASGLFVIAWSRDEDRTRIEEGFGPREPRGLFDEHHSGNQEMTKTRTGVDDDRARILERAASRDFAALEDAHKSGDARLYDEALNALIDSGTQPETCEVLVRYISRSHGLRANPRLAEMMIQVWRSSSPSLNRAIDLLHVAALSDDAALYHAAVDEVLDAWRGGKLDRISSEDLKELVESQFWLMAQHARIGGAGFQLKRRLAGIRRELAAASSVR